MELRARPGSPLLHYSITPIPPAVDNPSHPCYLVGTREGAGVGRPMAGTCMRWIAAACLCGAALRAAAQEVVVPEEEAADAQTNAPSRVGVAAFPIIFYTPETSAGAGGGVTLTYRGPGEEDTARPDNLSLFALYTFKNQFMFFLAPSLYFRDGDWKLGAGTGYSHFPGSFYGVGNDTDEDDEEEFTTESVMIRPGLLRRVYAHLSAGFFYDWKKTGVREIEKNGLLDTGDYLGVDGSVLSGAGAVLEWDSRDNLFSPSRGGRYEFSAGFYRDAFGSDFEYEEYTLDLRHYVPLEAGRVLALQLYATSRSGEVVFNEYARLENMRGIVNSRFRDRRAASAQAEYRFPVYRRFSGAVFASVGDVFDDPDDWEAKDIKYAGGFGVRYMLNEKERINLRFDIGFSPWGVAPYIRMMEAF